MAGAFIEVDTQQLERDMWDGPANIVFRQQFAKDREEFEAMCKEMESLIESLTYAKWEYEKCENQVSAAIAAIRI